jgi:8-oxo-dGTP pyrophosphatase MutT (NUDIX family)
MSTAPVSPKDSEAVPAATILLLRDGDAGPEVFMVRRHHEVEFAAGALVFPGGKAAPDDFDPVLIDRMDRISGWTREMHAVAAAAIREAFEEAGVLLAHDEDSGELVSEVRLAALDHYRERIEKGETSLVAMLRQERLRLACDRLVHFAHWVTPKHMPRRYDTHFFLARAPVGHSGQHCGRESVDSLWVRPQDAIAHRKEWRIMFPTRLNLMKLQEAKTVDDALSRARAAEPPVTVEPWAEETPDGKRLRIRQDAGYDLTNVPLRDG